MANFWARAAIPEILAVTEEVETLVVPQGTICRSTNVITRTRPGLGRRAPPSKFEVHTLRNARVTE